ncbi:hypothetical protein jhhlp_000400 [Lomentospora prolificans]|uniref:Beta-lactamase-related domain-containing protein n=1 Tax=Lomentospora prolificans TaxID=41688 RepID=A0A2N3NKV9_9PEZI|nr:hypothetical protein jhhlp_000400 [Lomentospora prolificans]
MEAKLSSILQDHIATGEDTKGKLLGASFIVVTKDDVLYSGSAGRIAPATSSPAWTDKSFTWLASMSKIITISAMMQLVERGLISLDTDCRPLVKELGVAQILKGFEGDKPILEPNTKPMTFKHLLTHTAGFGVDIADPDLIKWAKVTDRKVNCHSWSKAGFNIPLKFAPGEGWYYGFSTDWAGQVLEAVTGKRLSEYVQENVFDPLGMKDSGFWPYKMPQITDDQRAAYLYRQEDGQLKAGPPEFNEKEHEIESAGAGIFTTPRDYAVFLSGLIAGKVVKQETLELILTPQINETQEYVLNLIAKMVKEAFAPEWPGEPKLTHGIGGVISIEDIPGKRHKGSLAWSGAANSRWWYDPKAGIAAFVITSVQPHGDPVMTSLWDKLERAVYEHLPSTSA